MSRLSVAQLTSGLLVCKGTAGPSFAFYDEAGAATASPDAKAAPAPKKPADGFTRVSLRVDPARNRRLRIAAAQFGQTGPELLLAALDHYLDQVVPRLLDGKCSCLGFAAAGASGISMFSTNRP